MATLQIGQSVTNTITFLDQNGHPLVATPIPDSVPVWTNDTPGVESLTVATNGLSAVLKAISPGVDTTTVVVIVGGTKFSATVMDTVAVTPQVLTSIAIVQSIPA